MYSWVFEGNSSIFQRKISLTRASIINSLQKHMEVGIGRGRAALVLVKETDQLDKDIAYYVQILDMLFNMN